MIMKKPFLLFLAALIIIGVGSCWAQDRAPAFEMNERLGRGINMGNSFEAPSETEWEIPGNLNILKL